MRRTRSLLVILALILAAPLAAIDTKAAFAQDSPEGEPSMTGARLVGKKLYVVGSHFAPGAQILVNGEPIKTKNDPDTPSNLLIAKKGKKQMPNETTVVLTVRNGGGATSQPMEFFSGLTLTVDDRDSAISLKVGQKFELSLNVDPYVWTLRDFDNSLIAKLSEPGSEGSQGVFQALKEGSTDFSAIGDATCRKSLLPCLIPALLFQVKLNIE